MNLDFPIFVTQPELEKIAKTIIVSDIQEKMTSGVDLNNNAHKQNTNATRINKGLRGLSTRVPLIASGQLLSSFRINLVGDNAVQIMPRGTRKPYPKIKSKYRLKKVKSSSSQNPPTNYQLADILQNRGVRNSGHKYEFFGISLEAEGKAMKWMHNYIEKAIKRGGRKTVR